MSAKFEKFSRRGHLPPLKFGTQLKQLDEITLYYYRLINPRGETVLSSDGYSSIELRDKAIAAVKLYADYDERFERCSSPDSKWFFTLRAGNFKVIGRSRHYNTDQEMEAGITELRSIVANAAITECLSLEDANNNDQISNSK